MNLCIQCGTNLRENANVCQQCGHRNAPSKPSASTTPMAPPPKKISAPPPIAIQKHAPIYLDEIKRSKNDTGLNKAIIGLTLFVIIALGSYFLKSIYLIEQNQKESSDISANNTLRSVEPKSESDPIKLESPKIKVAPSENLPIPKDNSELVLFVPEHYLSAAASSDWSRIETLISNTVVPLIAKGNRKAARKLNEQAITELRNNNPNKAALLLNQALTEDPSDMEVRNNMGFAQLKSGDLANAKKTYIETLSYAPTRSITWGNLAEVYANEGALESASAALRLEVYLANDKKKTIAGLQKISESETPEVIDNKLTKIITKELSMFSDIPERK